VARESEQRREARFPARITCYVERRGQRLELLTNDVSFRGAFLRTDAPPALRQLVKVAFTLPKGTLVSAHAMIVHVVQPGSDQVPGVGVQFWGPVQEAKAWEQWVYDLKVREKAGALSSRSTDKVRRTSERFKLSLAVVLDGKTTRTRDLSETGMAVQSDTTMPLGMRVQMQVSAPGREKVDVDVIVRRHIQEPAFRGLGVEFVDITPEVRTALTALLRGVAGEDDAVFVDVDDPELH